MAAVEAQAVVGGNEGGEEETDEYLLCCCSCYRHAAQPRRVHLNFPSNE